MVAAALPGPEYGPMTEMEVEELDTCEQVIAYGIRMFAAACRALRTIRDRRLYRRQFESWQAYITARWSMMFEDSGTADRWIKLANVQDRLTPVGVTIEHERHAREIAKYEPAIQSAIALVGVRAAALEGRPVTEGHFKRAGEVIAQMTLTGSVELGNGQQHPMIETLAAGVVERRRESVLQHIATKARTVLLQVDIGAVSADVGAGGILIVRSSLLKPGVLYEVKVFEKPVGGK